MFSIHPLKIPASYFNNTYKKHSNQFINRKSSDTHTTSVLQDYALRYCEEWQSNDPKPR